MKNFAAVASVLCMSASTDAIAGMAMRGVGTSTCAEYANLYKIDPGTTDNVYFAWAQGFLSGMNAKSMHVHAPTVDLASLTVEAQERRIRFYCDQHPLADYVDAVIRIYNGLSVDPDSTLPGAYDRKNSN